jgi:hypothetical protein
MKTPFLSRYLLAPVPPLFLIAAMAIFPVRTASAADSDEDPSVLSAISMNWLTDWDAMNWDACWNAFSPDVRLNIRVALDRWDLRAKYFQEHLGKLNSRKFSKVESTIIPGDVVIVEFASSFEHVGPRSEGIYLEKLADGSWSVYGYWNKPVTTRWPRQWAYDLNAGARPLDESFGSSSFRTDFQAEANPFARPGWPTPRPSGAGAATPFGGQESPRQDGFPAETNANDMHAPFGLMPEFHP